MIDVTFHRREAIARNTVTFWFRPARPVRYLAGQFTELSLPHKAADERGTKRWFTLSSSPAEELVSITTRLAPRGGSTFKRHLAALLPGAALKLADPMGDFVLPKDPAIPLLFVVAGLGITPVRSMVQWLSDTGQRRQIALLYSVSQPDDLAFAPLFKDYGVRFKPLVKRPSDSPGGNAAGQLTTGRIMEAAESQGRPLIYLSGPEIMVETFYKELQRHGISADRLVGDYFPGYQRI